MSEFYSVIQLLATLAVGFVILGYSDYFIKTLTNFFHAEQTISDAEKECRKNIPDKSTRNNLKPANVGRSGNTSKLIEELRIDCDDMDERVDDFVKQSKAKFEEMSKVRSLVSTSLFVLMVSVALIFLPSLQNLWPVMDEMTNLFLLPFSVLSILYIILGWFFGEKECVPSCLKFSSLKHPIICFLVALALSLAFACIGEKYSLDIGDSWKFLFVALIIVGWLNFFVYACIIKHSMNRFKALVEEKKDPIVKECESKQLNKRCDELLTVKKYEQLADKDNAFAIDVQQHNPQ